MSRAASLYSTILLSALTALSVTACVDKNAVNANPKKYNLPADAKVTKNDTLIASGRVVNVADGDTVTVLASDKQTYKIRLQGIDAPEKAQPYGQQCKEKMLVLAVNLPAEVEVFKKDKYGRLVAKVTVDGKDIALEQIKEGCGWHYMAYAKEQPPADQTAYAAAEKQARKSNKGLWKDKSPVAPWDFRRTQP